MTSDIVIGTDRLEMTRYFAYPREAVFDAWTRPEHVEQWWGCRETEKVTSTIDLRVGGEFHYVMHIKNVGEVDYRGTFVELIAPEKIVSRTQMGPDADSSVESTVTVEFSEEGGGTRVKLTQVGLPPMPNIGEIVSTGFTAAFDKLDRLLGA